MRYAQHASPDFNARLHQVLQRLAGDVRRILGPNLLALVLGGGYGRGEGGIVRRDGVELPYNDLDLALLVHRPLRVPRAALEGVCGRYARELDIHVDVTRPLTLRDVRRWPCHLMWSDLVQGHVILDGPSDVLRRNAPPALLGPVPPLEATKLLLNRGAGLLWSWRVRRGVEPSSDPDFVRRNYWKCALGLGDAVLIAHRRFSTPYRGRDLRLATLAGEHADVAALSLTDLYEDALRFKFCPDDLPLDPPTELQLAALARAWGAVLLLVERGRTGREFDSIEEYVRWDGLRDPAQSAPRSWPRNLVRNLALRRLSLHHPREALFRALPSLLHADARALESVPWRVRGERFLQVWKHVN